jgi:glycogen(starch) synthase
MNILIHSSVFYPSIGGIETITEVLGQEFVRQGYQTKVITNSMDRALTKPFNFEVYRKPSVSKTIDLVKWADIVLCQCISLKFILLPLLYRKKTVVIHHTWYARDKTGRKGIQDYLKLWICKVVKNVAISEAIKRQISNCEEIIYNPINVTAFKSFADAEKNKDIVFVGRLVSDKGCDLLIRALHSLALEGRQFSVTIIGDGPERKRLELLVHQHKLNSCVTFTGALRGADLASEISNHKVMVIPSIWNEPYGIVAIEGLAAGCYLIGSSGGGLGEIISKVGCAFPNGNEIALADSIRNVFSNEEILTNFADQANALLHVHTATYSASRYIKVFNKLLHEN